MSKERSCWLVKTEPDCFSIQHLAVLPNQTTCWDGVRNYQARNFMRAMKSGDRVLFYHSSADPPAVAGTAVVVREAYPDHTAWDPGNQHFDPKASPDNPVWQMVDIKLEEVFASPVAIGTLRSVPALRAMELLRTGSRLSVQPVKPREFETVLAIARETGAPAAKPRPVASAKRPTKRAAAPTKKKRRAGPKKMRSTTGKRTVAASGR